MKLPIVRNTSRPTSHVPRPTFHVPRLTFLCLGMVILLSACSWVSPTVIMPTESPPTTQLDDTPTPFPTKTDVPIPTVTPTVTPVEERPEERPTKEDSSSIESMPEENVAIDSMDSMDSMDSNIAMSPMFDLAWEDRTPFEAGLIESEQAILDELLVEATIYHIKLTVSPELDHLSGEQALLFTNRETQPLDDIQFRLFPNIMGGTTEVTEVYLNDESVEPTYSHENSAMNILLPEPLLSGEQVVLSMNFEVEIPTSLESNYGALAFAEEVLAAAHVYPMIPVYDDEGWNVEVAPSYGDVVYADANFYIVQISAPAKLVLATSGVEIDQQINDEIQTRTYAVGPARDFYFVGSEKYVVISETVGDVTINSYAFPEQEEGSKQLLVYTTDAMESFIARFGPYPYVELDMISTPTLALGIEYPGITVNTQQMYDIDAEMYGRTGRVFLESTVTHEVAHQWFYNIIGSDQLDEPWVDEALTQYATWLYYVDAYGEENAEGFFGSFEGRWDRVEQADIPIGLPVAKYEGAEYGAVIYGRGPIFVRELSEEMGTALFEEFLRDYYQTHKWRIASTESFKTLAESHCDCDLTPMFEAAVYPKE